MRIEITVGNVQAAQISAKMILKAVHILKEVVAWSDMTMLCSKNVELEMTCAKLNIHQTQNWKMKL